MKMCEKALLYFYEELPAEERGAFKEHLAACAGCRARLELLRQTQEALQAPAAPQAVVDGLFAKTTRKKSWGFTFKQVFASLALAAAGVVLVLCSGVPGRAVYDRQEVLAYLTANLDEDYTAFASELDELENDF